MKDTDEDFNDIVNAQAEHDADKLLDKQLNRVREWIDYKESMGEKPTLRALTQEMVRDRSQRNRIRSMIMLAAALWRLLQKEDQ